MGKTSAWKAAGKHERNNASESICQPRRAMSASRNVYTPPSVTCVLESEALRMHGMLGSSSWELPSCVTSFDVAARDYCYDRIMAHEYLDSNTVLVEKVRLL